MTVEQVRIDGTLVWAEVSDVSDVRSDVELTSSSIAGELLDVGNDLRSILLAVTRPVKAAFEDAVPTETSIEVNIGFKGQAGIPFLASGEANGGIKVTLKWTKDKA